MTFQGYVRNIEAKTGLKPADFRAQPFDHRLAISHRYSQFRRPRRAHGMPSSSP